ncbi:oxidoreductase [Jannaschia sp. EhC01]|nr:oxidoreductase [Jannaschia sp. EhC01]
MTRPIRLGMVGGGAGAFIGQVHRIAARLDGQYQLVAGALSSRADVARTSAEDLGIVPDRSYDNFHTMAVAEAARDDGIEVVAIVTPNHLHAAPTKAFLEAGIHVICDKPLTASLNDALDLARVTPANDAKFLLTHNYTGYPMVRHAKGLIEGGQLGTLRLVQVEYAQDWLTKDVSNKQADWRADPTQSGAGGCISDIGTHAFNLARFVTGLQLDSLSADLEAFVGGRLVDDNVHMMLRFDGGAKGMLWASQVAPGNENGLSLRIYGEKGGLEWRQTEANVLRFSPFGEPTQVLSRGNGSAVGDPLGIRIPAGHPEGYLEAFGTLYSDFAKVIRGQKSHIALPDLQDGLEGMRFIEAALASSAENGTWKALSQV